VPLIELRPFLTHLVWPLLGAAAAFFVLGCVLRSPWPFALAFLLTGGALVSVSLWPIRIVGFVWTGLALVFVIITLYGDVDADDQPHGDVDADDFPYGYVMTTMVLDWVFLVGLIAGAWAWRAGLALELTKRDLGHNLAGAGALVACLAGLMVLFSPICAYVESRDDLRNVPMPVRGIDGRPAGEGGGG